MSPATIFATLRRRGADLHLVEGDHLAVAPKGALDDDLRAAVRELALIAVLKTKVTPPDPTVLLRPCSNCSGAVLWRRPGEVALHCATCNPCDDRFQALWYAAVAADDPFAELFDPGTRTACALVAARRPAMVGELLALERAAELLAESGDVDACRAAVAALVGYVGRLAGEYEGGHG